MGDVQNVGAGLHLADDDGALSGDEAKEAAVQLGTGFFRLGQMGFTKLERDEFLENCVEAE